MASRGKIQFISETTQWIRVYFYWALMIKFNEWVLRKWAFFVLVRVFLVLLGVKNLPMFENR